MKLWLAVAGGKLGLYHRVFPSPFDFTYATSSSYLPPHDKLASLTTSLGKKLTLPVLELDVIILPKAT